MKIITPDNTLDSGAILIQIQSGDMPVTETLPRLIHYHRRIYLKNII